MKATKERTYKSQDERQKDDEDQMRMVDFAEGTWIKFKLDLMDDLQCDANVLFCYLANQQYLNFARTRTLGWFYCRNDRITEELGFSRHTLTRLFKVLLELKLISTKWQKHPKHRQTLRYIKINYAKAEKMRKRYWRRREKV